jgi:adenylylsulfate kinase
MIASDVRPLPPGSEKKRCAQVIWIYGRPAAGKTTLAKCLMGNLEARGVASCILDGDELRQGLSRDLGFSMSDRNENLRRAAETARLISDAGICVIAALVTPMAKQRELVASIVGPDRIRLVYLSCPHETCVQRDPKGLYARAMQGTVKQMTGIDSEFEPPLMGCRDLVLSSDTLTPACMAEVLADMIR